MSLRSTRKRTGPTRGMTGMMATVWIERMLRAGCVLAALFLGLTVSADETKPPGDTTVYYKEGKKRVHVKECRRLVSTEGKTVMTLAEAEKKGVPLCSRCPGSTTDGKGNPEPDEHEVESSTIHSGDVTVYSGGGKRVHVVGCRRLTTDPGELAKMTKMTLAEAEAKGLPLCSRCPGSTTSGKGNPDLPESWVKPAPDEVTRKPFTPSSLAPLVSVGSDGRLVYKPYTDKGDRILDFSTCGYRKSEVPIPNVPAAVTLTAPAGEAVGVDNMKYAVGPDSHARIQAALDKVAAMKPDADGIRGAVLLKKGTWYLSDSLIVRAGVVLRGEGDGEDGTTLIFTMPAGDGIGIQLGGGGMEPTTEALVPITGTLSKDEGVSGDDVYILTLKDGYSFKVSNPRFKPELKLEGFVGSRVTLTMKAIVTTDGDASRSHLKHNMPYEVDVVEAGQPAPPIDPNLKLPEAAFGTAAAPESKIADDYVPSGSSTLTLQDAGGFKVGDAVMVYKTTNQQWIDDLGMGERLRHIRGGKEGSNKRPWTPQTYRHLRKITAIDGNTVTLDVMLPQSIAAVHGGGFVRKVTGKAVDSQCGVESIRIVSNHDATVEDSGKSANFRNLRNGIAVDCRDGWVRDCTVKHVWFAAVNMSGQFCTVRDTKSLEPVGPKRGGRRYTFSIGGDGLGNLVYNCFAEDGRHDFVVGARNMGPNAFVKCTALRGGQSEPHHRWGCGVLFDNITMKEGGSLAAINRGDSGSGHGWAGANTVIWNCAAENIVVFDPETKGENNFAIGYTGPMKEEFDTRGLRYANTRSGYWGTPREGAYYGYALMGNGHIESPDGPVKPDSLFVQQLIDRIGETRAMQVIE